MVDNLRFWKAFADIDPKFTKPITGKPYKGTSPNPQYVIQCLTEMFGPVGEGFGWNVEREEFQPLGDDVLHWCRIRFWHSSPENGFDSYGQTKALMKTKNGPLLDEDAPKKSLTDAIVKAASHIGVASNIFLGRWDDQKYVAQVEREFRDAEAPAFDAAGAHQRIEAKLNKAKSLEQLVGAWKAEWATICEIEQAKPELAAHLTTLKDTLKVKLPSDPARQAPEPA